MTVQSYKYKRPYIKDNIISLKITTKQYRPPPKLVMLGLPGE